MPTPADLQRTLAKQMLKANAAKVIDVFQTWDVDGSGTISKKEFRQAVQPLLGLPAGPEVLDELFDMFDDDRLGEITLKELNNVLRRLGALTRFCNLDCYYCWVRSADNPADAPSRWGSEKS